MYSALVNISNDSYSEKIFKNFPQAHTIKKTFCFYMILSDFRNTYLKIS